MADPSIEFLRNSGLAQRDGGQRGCRQGCTGWRYGRPCRHAGIGSRHLAVQRLRALALDGSAMRPRSLRACGHVGMRAAEGEREIAQWHGPQRKSGQQWVPWRCKADDGSGRARSWRTAATPAQHREVSSSGTKPGCAGGTLRKDLPWKPLRGVGSTQPWISKCPARSGSTMNALTEVPVAPASRIDPHPAANEAR
jgi:hypothetical protein